jgi:NAD(P)-dependent dehydrogenase (short-subunit alcohol dehydrogenase family)
MSMTEPSPFPTNEFADKRVLVTGGTRGIGAAVVRRFRLAGARARRGRRPVHLGIAVTKLHLTRARVIVYLQDCVMPGSVETAYRFGSENRRHVASIAYALPER